jgi:hypothetical protein
MSSALRIARQPKGLLTVTVAIHAGLLLFVLALMIAG